MIDLINIRRARLYKGRNIHAVVNPIPVRPISLCGYPIQVRADEGNDYPMPDETTVTCPACVRRADRAPMGADR